MFFFGSEEADPENVEALYRAVEKIRGQIGSKRADDLGAILRCGYLPPSPQDQVTFVNGIYDKPAFRFFSPMLSNRLLAAAKGSK